MAWETSFVHAHTFIHNWHFIPLRGSWHKIVALIASLWQKLDSFPTQPCRNLPSVAVNGTSRAATSHPNASAFAALQHGAVSFSAERTPVRVTATGNPGAAFYYSGSPLQNQSLLVALKENAYLDKSPSVCPRRIHLGIVQPPQPLNLAVREQQFAVTTHRKHEGSNPNDCPALTSCLGSVCYISVSLLRTFYSPSVPLHLQCE